MKILAVDPGLVTGLAFKDFDEDFFTPPKTLMPEGFVLGAEAIDDALAHEVGGDWDRLVHGTPDLIVYERFQITPKTASKTTQGSGTAIELIGVLRYFAYVGGFKLEEQRPSDAMNFASDDKLRRIGWYKPGRDHARDAMRHLLLAAVRHNQVDLTQLLPDS